MELIKSDSNNLNHVLYNTHILENIFSNMDLYNLKNVRHVCRLWSNEAVRGFKNKILVHHNPSLLKKNNPINVTSFLLNHKIEYALLLSFLSYPWYPCKPVNRIQWKTQQKKYLNQRNNRKYLEVLSTSFLQSCSDLYFKELRIELNICRKGDSDLFVTMLSKTVNLEILAIDFVLVKKAEVKSLPDELFIPLNNLKLLAFRCGYQYKKSEVLDLECWVKVLGLFPGIKYLDLYSWQQGCIWHQELQAGSIELCSQALQFLYKEKQYFQHLEGWRYNRMNGDPSQMERPLLPFSQQLKYIVIRGCGIEKEILSYYHLPNLKRCELMLELDTNYDPRLENTKLLCLPSLQYFSLCVNNRDNNFKESDILKMRKIILGGAESFKQHFPSLHTLNMVVPMENDKEYFNYVFPKEVNIKIHGVTSFLISLSEDCESEEITRFYSMFPDLEILKHVRKDDKYSNCFVICTHILDKKTKIFNPVTNYLVKILKYPDTSETFTYLIYYQLRGKFCQEPFYSGYKVKLITEYSEDTTATTRKSIIKILAY